MTEEELAAALADLPGWQQGKGCILKVFEFADFAASMRFVHRAADLAEARNHHPEILIEFSRVTLTLHSHDVNAITKRDIGYAKAIES